ncbi:MAG TPA: Xaa-Pro dipeptidase, partial [Chloroflexi bacterium]|nr:Xaa-Pro dipeptidase [Chloroflexota bacterium]
MTSRLATLRAQLDARGLDGLLITQPENRRYLSGFTGSSGVLLVTSERTLIVTDSRYYEQVGREAPQCELVRQTGRQPEAIGALLERLDLRRVGI